MEKIGKYEVQKLVRTSSCSDLYLCYDPDFKMQVAVKLFMFGDGHPVRMTEKNREFWQVRFVEEAKLLARFDHPNIISVRELSYLDDGSPFLVMPFIEANLRYEIGHDIEKPLSEYIENPSDPLPPKKPSVRRSADILIGIADALAYMHNNGFVHRDIKPGNILLTKRHGGWPKLCDFGFTFKQGTGNPNSNFWMGTKVFMSPEQYENADRATFASDVYSLGILGYRLLSGALPLNEYPPIKEVNKDCPDDLAKLVEEMMEKSPEKRPQNAKVVLQSLKKIDPILSRQKIRLKDSKKTILKLR